MISGRRTIALLALNTLLFCPLAAFAQQGPAPGGPQGPMKFTNLQVLPQDIPPQKLFGLMRQYSQQLGVQCGFCHEIDQQTHRPKFASDAKPEKKTARLMIRMTEAIDQKYLAELPGGQEHKDEVSCWTCHRGHNMPDATPALKPEQEHEHH